MAAGSFAWPTWRRADGVFRINAQLRLYPGVLSPADVTQRLDLRPTRAIDADVVAAAPAIGRQPRHNGWFLDSESLVASSDELAHLEWLLLQLESRRQPLDAILKRPDAKGSIGLTLWTEQGGCSVEIPPAWLARIGAFNVPFWVDFADYPQERPNAP